MSNLDESVEPAAKRARIASPGPSEPAAQIIIDTPSLIAPSVLSDPAPAAIVEKAVDPFSFEGETGLFGSLLGKIGRKPVTEPEVGITEFIDPSIAAISGIIKHRFTDFLVFEVGLDGETVRLKSLSAPKGPARPKESITPVASTSDAPIADTEPLKAVVAAPPADLPLWNPASEAAMAALLSPEQLEDFKSFVLAGTPARQAEYRHNKPIVTPSEIAQPQPAWGKVRTNFQSPVMENKVARTAFHNTLRENFAGKFVSEMKELDNKDQVIEVKWNVRGQNTRGPARPPRDEKAKSEADNLPPYIHFTLQKTNREMQDALGGLCRALHIQNRDLGTAGTKDKRGITVQRVSMKRGHRTLGQVFNAARGAPPTRGGRGGGRGGYNGNTGERGVKIGDLEYKDFAFDLGMLKGNKFIITLRDVQADSPEAIADAVETLRSKGFINYYGMQRFGTAPIPTHAIGLALLRSDWALATNLILRQREGDPDDTTDSRNALFNDKNLEKAMKLMPRRCVAEKAILEHYFYNKNENDHLSALTRIPKNLRMMFVHGWQSYIWNTVLSERVRLFGCDKPVVGDLVYSAAEGSGEGDEDEEILDEEDEGTTAVDPESLDPNLDDDETGEEVTHLSRPTAVIKKSKVAKARALTEQDIASNRYTIFDVILPLPGFSIIYPEGVLGDRYKQIMKDDGLDWQDLFRKQKEYSLGGAYRKILHLPSAVTHKLIPYSDPNIDLAQSDEDILLRKKLPNPIVPGEPLNLALQIELTLGSSTYATMALRELLKSRTSSIVQRGLTEAMATRLTDAATISMDVDSQPVAIVESEEAAEERARDERMANASVIAEDN